MLSALLAELLRRGYSREDIKKVAGQNLLRHSGGRRKWHP